MAMEVETQSGFPYWQPLCRKFKPDSPFFSSGNIERELLAKQVALDFTEDQRHYVRNFMDEDCRVISCPIAGCGARLASLEDFEDHHNARHAASCSVCSRVYPTSRLLGIHISEAHDSFFQAKVAQGYDMYECLVEGCALKFKSYKSRHQHLVDKHKFPASFDFFKKARPSKKHRHKERRSKPSNQEHPGSSNDMEVEKSDTAVDGLVCAVSKLNTSDSSPSSVSFGRRNARGLTFVPRAVQRDKRPDST